MQSLSFCLNCGAPIYVPLVWDGITPPLPVYSCVCNLSAIKTESTVNSIDVSLGG